MIWTLIKLHNEYVMKQIALERAAKDHIADIRHKNMLVAMHKKESFIAGAEWQKQNNGGIVWFKCEDQLPPIKYPHALGKPSDKVLVWGKGGWPQFTYYVHDAKEWFCANELPFIITHWCYINYPE
jgi:hypothetical protein